MSAREITSGGQTKATKETETGLKTAAGVASFIPVIGAPLAGVFGIVQDLFHGKEKKVESTSSYVASSAGGVSSSAPSVMNF